MTLLPLATVDPKVTVKSPGLHDQYSTSRGHTLIEKGEGWGLGRDWSKGYQRLTLDLSVRPLSL